MMMLRWTALTTLEPTIPRGTGKTCHDNTKSGKIMSYRDGNDTSLGNIKAQAPQPQRGVQLGNIMTTAPVPGLSR